VRDDLLILPIFQYTNIQGVREGLVGYRHNGNALVNTWNCEEWYWAT
jgi:peptide/nickel transport system substrate-binding protein